MLVQVRQWRVKGEVWMQYFKGQVTWPIYTRLAETVVFTIFAVKFGCFWVFSTSGGMGPSASVFFKRLASLLSMKRNAHYGSVMSWIRCKISFALIHSAILCLRGTRSRPIPLSLDFDHALAECRIAPESIAFTVVFCFVLKKKKKRIRPL